MDGVGLNLRGVVQESVEDIHRFPNTAGNEVTEQRDVGIGNVIVADAAVAPIANVVLR